MKFRVVGHDRISNEPIEMVFEAVDAQTALISAQGRGMVVAAINPVFQNPVSPPPISQSPIQTRLELPVPAEKKGSIKWLLILSIAALFGTISKPLIGFLFSGSLFALMLFHAFAKIRPISRAVLGLSTGRPFATTVRMILAGSLALIILISAVGSQGIKSAQKAAEAEQTKKNAEREHLIAEGNAKVESFLAEAQQSLSLGDIARASNLLTDLLKVPHATNKQPGKRLNDVITLATDSTALRKRLLTMDDENFATLASGGKLPPSLNVDYQALERSLITLAQPLLKEVAAERKALEKKRTEEAEQRRKNEFAKTEAERKEREQKAKIEAAEKAAAGKAIKGKVDAYLALLAADDFASKIVQDVSVSQNGNIWTATIRVKNLWHIRNKQLRYQDAQNLWSAWATLTSKADPDRARIKLVDLNGNEVGGSRVLAGSLIWVQD